MFLADEVLFNFVSELLCLLLNSFPIKNYYIKTTRKLFKNYSQINGMVEISEE